jgi:hypothetical protein
MKKIISTHFKNIRKKGLSKLVFIALAAMMIVLTIIAVFQ